MIVRIYDDDGELLVEESVTVTTVTPGVKEYFLSIVRDWCRVFNA